MLIVVIALSWPSHNGTAVRIRRFSACDNLGDFPRALENREAWERELTVAGARACRVVHESETLLAAAGSANRLSSSFCNRTVPRFGWIFRGFRFAIVGKRSRIIPLQAAP